MEDYIRRYVTKDGSQRISFYRDEHAGNPRYNTDEPLHCEDWSRDYSIMNKQERESKSSSARSLLEYMIRNYGDWKKIINSLVANGKKVGKEKVEYGTALVYDRTRRGWILIGDINCYFGSEIENGWYEYNFLDGKKDDIDLYHVLEDATDDAIEYFANNFMTDGVKIASYSFGYNGEISFSDEISCDSEGICWLEKDEFLKYSGCKEEYWKSKTFKEIEFLCDEIEAWGDNEVYGFKVEERHRFKLHKEYIDEEREDEDTEDEEWEETGSCWGFYGELSKSEEWILEEAGFKKEDLIEE